MDGIPSIIERACKTRKIENTCYAHYGVLENSLERITPLIPLPDRAINLPRRENSPTQTTHEVLTAATSTSAEAMLVGLKRHAILQLMARKLTLQHYIKFSRRETDAYTHFLHYCDMPACASSSHCYKS